MVEEGGCIKASRLKGVKYSSERWLESEVPEACSYPRSIATVPVDINLLVFIFD